MQRRLAENDTEGSICQLATELIGFPINGEVGRGPSGYYRFVERETIWGQGGGERSYLGGCHPEHVQEVLRTWVPLIRPAHDRFFEANS